MKDAYRRWNSFIEAYGKVIFCATLFFILGSSVYSLLEVAERKKLEVTFLNVGQGDAILVTTPGGKQMLIDGGATHIVLEEVAKHISYFDSTIDIVVATHPDADHVTGLIPVLQKYNVATVVTSNVTGSTGIFTDLTEKINDEGAIVHVARKNDTIDFGDGVSAYILYPKNQIAKDTNDGSVSMVITYGGHSFLLSGDLSSAYERELIDDSVPKHVTVWKAGHHGSRTSSSELLLSYIRPEYAVISAGKDNDYGHPHVEVLERFQKYAKETLSTIDSGSITFVSDGRVLEVEKER